MERSGSMLVGKRMTLHSAQKDYKGKALVIRDEHRANDGTVLDAMIVSALSNEEVDVGRLPDGCKVLSSI